MQEGDTALDGKSALKALTGGVQSVGLGDDLVAVRLPCHVSIAGADKSLDGRTCGAWGGWADS